MGSGNVQTTAFHPDGRTNSWLSLGFKTALNDEEVRLQQKALNELNNRPIHAQMIQLESLYKQIALLNYQIQDSEARKTPGRIITSTIQLNLLGQATDGAVDQILPSNRSRKALSIIADVESAYISNEKLQSIQSITNVGSLVRVPYAEIPVGIRVPLDSTAPLYAISSSNATACILTIIEEVYITPNKLSDQYKLAKAEEEGITSRGNWIERAIDSL